MGKKWISIVIVIVISSLLLAGASFFLWEMYINPKNPEEEKKKEEEPIEKVVELVVETEEITTNLYNNENVIRTKFKIQMENEESKEEIEKRMFEVKGIIIKILASKDMNMLSGEDGMVKLENEIKIEVNKIMQSGKVIKIFTISRIMQ